MQIAVLPIILFVVCLVGLAVVLLIMGNVFGPSRTSPAKRMPYESGMDPLHDTRRRFDVRFYLLAIAFLVFDVELLFLYPWAVTARPAKLAAAGVVAAQPAEAQSHTDLGTIATLPEKQATEDRSIDRAVAALKGHPLVDRRAAVFPAVMVFIGLLTLGFIYDWRKGIFRWR